MSEDNPIFQSALAKHVERFSNPDHTFSPATVAAGLEKIHSSQALLKGTVISTFNASHASNKVCPVMRGNFSPDENNSYANTLHLGTTRVWNADGTINEERWNKLKNYAVNTRHAEQPENVITQSQMQEYLKICYQTDLPEQTTGRNANALFSCKHIQKTAATAAWDEVFDRLACGWVPNENGKLEPYISLEMIRLFFENTTQVFEQTERGELPVAKPSTCPVHVVSSV